MRTLLVCLIALAVAIAGCTDEPEEEDNEPNQNNNDGGQNNTTEPQVVDLSVAAVGVYPANPAFDPATLSAPANSTVNLTFANNEGNPAGINHDWVLRDVDGAKTEVIGAGETATISFTAPAPGEYTYFCSVPGHEGRGMVGTFTVTA